MSSEQVKSSGRIATFSLWTGISSIPDETVVFLWLDHHCLMCENGIPQNRLPWIQKKYRSTGRRN